jgi:hypothetical protein
MVQAAFEVERKTLAGHEEILIVDSQCRLAVLVESLISILR